MASQVTLPTLGKTEINFQRLLVRCEKQAETAEADALSQDPKFHSYVSTLRDLLSSLQGADAQQALASIDADRESEYQRRVKVLLEKLDMKSAPDVWHGLQRWPSFDPAADACLPDATGARGSSGGRSSSSAAATGSGSSPGHQPTTGLRQRHGVHSETKERPAVSKASAGLASSTASLIERHRQLQEDLTDEMVEMARQIKDNSLQMDQSLRSTMKVLDSTEQGMEQSLASTNFANKRAMKIYSKAWGTGCLTWLILFAMSLVFLLMVFLIRIT